MKELIDLYKQALKEFKEHNGNADRLLDKAKTYNEKQAVERVRLKERLALQRMRSGLERLSKMNINIFIL